MSKLKRTINTLTIGVVLVLLVSCGGGGGSEDPVTAVVITASNAETLSIAALDTAQEAVVSQNANPYAISISPDSITTAVSQAISNIYRQQMSVNSVIIANGDCGGTVEIADPNASTGSMEFNAYCMSMPGLGNLVMDGSVNYSFNDPMLYLTYSNFTVSYGSEVINLNMSVAVNFDTDEVSWSSSFVGSNGATLTYSNFDIIGDPTNGISITSGRVTYSGLGFFDIYTTSPVIVTGCTNNRPMSGTIIVEGSNGSSASITFTDCNNYSWCYDLGDGSGELCDVGMW